MILLSKDLNKSRWWGKGNRKILKVEGGLVKKLSGRKNLK